MYRCAVVECILHMCVCTYLAGRSLSTLGSSVMLVNPDIQEAHELRGWCVVCVCVLVHVWGSVE